MLCFVSYLSSSFVCGFIINQSLTQKFKLNETKRQNMDRKEDLFSIFGKSINYESKMKLKVMRNFCQIKKIIISKEYNIHVLIKKWCQYLRRFFSTKSRRKMFRIFFLMRVMKPYGRFFLNEKWWGIQSFSGVVGALILPNWLPFCTRNVLLEHYLYLKFIYLFSTVAWLLLTDIRIHSLW